MDRPINVSIVEDNLLVQKSIVQLCSIRNIESQCFASAEEFLEAATDDASCLVIDYRLPGITGIELVQTLRQQGRETPVVLISGNFNLSSQDYLDQLTNTKCIDKPFRPIEFLESIENIVEQSSEKQHCNTADSKPRPNAAH